MGLVLYPFGDLPQESAQSATAPSLLCTFLLCEAMWPIVAFASLQSCLDLLCDVYHISTLHHLNIVSFIALHCFSFFLTKKKNSPF